MPLLQEIISARHFAELQAEERICPRGERRADLRAAYIAMQIVAKLAQHSGTVSLAEFMYEPDDLLTFHDEDDEPETEGGADGPLPGAIPGAIPGADQRIMDTMNHIMRTQNARNAELRRRQGKA